MNDYYVYGLVNHNNEIFYIGKGKGNRWKRHYGPSSIEKDPNRHKINTIIKTRKILGYDPQPVILKKNLCEEEAFMLEKKLVNEKCNILTNISPGGRPEGGFKEYHKRIRKHGLSDEHKRKISESHKGKKLSEEHKRVAINNLMKKGMSWEERYGVEKAKEHRKKCSEKTKGKTYEEIHGIAKAKELRKKRSNTMKGKIKSAEHRKNLSESKRKKYLKEIRTKYGITPEIEETIHANNTNKRGYTSQVSKQYNISWELANRIINNIY